MKYYIANWKMNMGLEDVTKWITNFSNSTHKQPLSKDKEVIVSPSILHLSLLSEINKKIGFELASQDVSIFDKGSHTGENGAFQIKELCKYCIIGHSERKESLETVLAKRDISIKQGLIPIICFIKPEDARRLYINEALMAWEDPNNISNNGEYREKDPKEIEKGVLEIKKLLPTNVKIIYGGSVNKNNIKNLLEIAEIDGVLIGNASLDSNHFADIIVSSL